MQSDLSLIKPTKELSFPPQFRFGVADADLQVIGEDYTLAEEGSEPTMWQHFTQERRLSTPGTGVDRYHRWREDLEQMRRLGIRDYRTSISMSRTLRQDGSINEKSMEWYKRYFAALKENGIAVYATLYHWELPQYLNTQGGWTGNAAVTALQRHAEVVAERLGEYIDEYFILNEPWCSSLLSYYEGRHAPGKQHEDERENLRAGLLAAHNLLLAQAKAFMAIKERTPEAKVGTVLNFEPSYAASLAPEDVQAAQYHDGYYNAWFIDPIYRGHYPEWMLELYKGLMPVGYEKDMESIKIGAKFHALGVNYYRGSIYRAAEGLLRSEQVLVEGGPTNGLGWPVFEAPYYPEGLYDLLQQIYYGYRAFGLERMYISENGTALNTPWDGNSSLVDDEPRVHYYKEHLRQLHKAL
ncbi:MAG: family 1 glycosylhydrolase, partial [Chloroflexota bacterium]|nr:family 1 glycosylhydrolase [Chloroflexota bacterium]